RAEITDDPCSVDYEPVGYRTLDRALRHVRPDPARDVFLDYGCGQGRALAVAAQRSFQKIIGVELSSALAAVARSNLDRARSKLRCRDCRVIAANAIEFNVPDDVSVIFLFNPFRGEVLEAAIDRIEASLRRRPRQLTILYVQPIRDKNVFAEQPWLVEKVNTLSEGLRLAVYESTVAADTSDHCHNRANQRASQHAI
ncbi:MAG: class I SAM-dependent methyltransferase, partial [Pirellulaceae bacterium]|nr:class I SAM-dependent methyltransferase [Pirellulaceae bacterium]